MKLYQFIIIEFFSFLSIVLGAFFVFFKRRVTRIYTYLIEKGIYPKHFEWQTRSENYYIIRMCGAFLLFMGILLQWLVYSKIC